LFRCTVNELPATAGTAAGSRCLTGPAAKWPALDE
jgi:hypothetical protein